MFCGSKVKKVNAIVLHALIKTSAWQDKDKNPFYKGDILYVLLMRKDKMPFEVTMRGVTDLEDDKTERALTKGLVIAADVGEGAGKGDILRKEKE